MRRLLDTNAVLYVLGGRLAEPLPPGEYFVSVITEMELFCYPSLDTESEERIRAFLSQVGIVGLTSEVKTIAIGLRREYALKLPDAIVAATAISLQSELLTNDDKLIRVPGLKVQQLLLRSVT